jgi:hypothetical protein
MTVKLAFKNSYNDTQLSWVWANSLALTDYCFVTKTGNVIDKAVAWGLIVWVNDTIATYASDNQTVDKKEVNYTPSETGRLYRVTITGGTITVADEGKFYNLSDEVTVNGTTESAVGKYTDTTGWAAVDPLISMQLELVTFESATESIFKIVI